MRLAGLDFRIDGSARGYYIIGRGAQDDGFNERGLSLGAQAVAGRDFGSFFVYGGARGLAEFDHDNFQNGETYSLNVVHFAPAICIDMRFLQWYWFIRDTSSFFGCWYIVFFATKDTV